MPAFRAIPFFDLKRQSRNLQSDLSKAFQKTARSGRFILGPEVHSFEAEFARFCGARHGIGVASGTDALELSLRALGVGPGDWVATVSFTFLATVDAIRHVGAEPFFVDIRSDTCTLDPEDLERRIRRLSGSPRKRLKAIVPVHLYGHPCDMTQIMKIARRYRLAVVEDAAQAAGARWKGRAVGSFGETGCFSFFPTKNLGSMGDAGLVVTSSLELEKKLRSLRVHGRNGKGLQALAFGRNSRLDELQAAVLRVKFRRLRGWVQRRKVLARLYTGRLAGAPGIRCPKVAPGATHAFCLYVIRVRGRARLQRFLHRHGVATQVYYAAPVHRQPIYRKKFSSLRLPETERASRELLALPIFPELELAEVRRICRLIRSAN